MARSGRSAQRIVKAAEQRDLPAWSLQHPVRIAVWEQVLGKALPRPSATARPTQRVVFACRERQPQPVLALKPRMHARRRQLDRLTAIEPHLQAARTQTGRDDDEWRCVARHVAPLLANADNCLTTVGVQIQPRQEQGLQPFVLEPLAVVEEVAFGVDAQARGAPEGVEVGRIQRRSLSHPLQCSRQV